MAPERVEPIPGQVAFIYGRGARTYVTLHGWSGDHRVYEPLMRGMSEEDVTMVAFDQPGSGESAAPAVWTMEAFIDPMLRALERLGIRRFTLAGNCAGAVTALEMATALGPSVERLVLIDPFAYVPWYFRLLTMPILGRLFYRTSFASGLGRLITDWALKGKQGSDTSLTRGFVSVSHDHAHAHLRMLCSLRDVSRYAGIPAPTDILFGSRTFKAVRRSVAMLREVLPRGATVELEGAGHLPIQEVTSRVASSVFRSEPEGFLAKAEVHGGHW